MDETEHLDSTPENSDRLKTAVDDLTDTMEKLLSARLAPWIDKVLELETELSVAQGLLVEYETTCFYPPEVGQTNGEFVIRLDRIDGELTLEYQTPLFEDESVTERRCSINYPHDIERPLFLHEEDADAEHQEVADQLADKVAAEAAKLPPTFVHPPGTPDGEIHED